MEIFYCESDIGSVLIGNNDWTFAVPNIGGDGTTRVCIFEKEDDMFLQYHKRKDIKFISSVQGTFNIYGYDCAFVHCLDEEIVATLSGRYGVFQGEWEVVFVKWE